MANELDKTKQVEVILTPQNEGQDLNYQERYTGNAVNIYNKAVEIRVGLTNLLQKGTFSVKIETSDYKRSIVLHETFLENEYAAVGQDDSDFYLAFADLIQTNRRRWTPGVQQASGTCCNCMHRRV